MLAQPDGAWFVAACTPGISGASWWGETTGSCATSCRFRARSSIHNSRPSTPNGSSSRPIPLRACSACGCDGSGLECLYEHDNDEFVVHETFLGSTGDLVFTVWPKALKRMNWQTRRITTIAEFNAWHISPNRAGTKVLCDTNHPDVGLQLVDVATGDAARFAFRKAPARELSGGAPATPWQKTGTPPSPPQKRGRP